MTPELKALLEGLDDKTSAEALALLMAREGAAQPDSGGTPTKPPVPPTGGH